MFNIEITLMKKLKTGYIKYTKFDYQIINKLNIKLEIFN